ncbi:Putative phosphinothricin acetyltransferase YwnH [Roseivivax sp. THAF40]|uniref:GNAT family N-acetyltransferase n=1 Tax=unclassified Roseivivax TaxID=2639302 RepID=UPI001268D694|nr:MULTISPECIES: GNAT family N-acetyltransferase [unclassified Roseivivax]QFS84702.1 Putative phosphinothricin acetyltransferase YwnH [Roseivivax sp. THAF197b]QFT48529.1 Putative phosphinothricin acetyltransferase YwnH [Roseivivax sp. THAF40]
MTIRVRRAGRLDLRQMAELLNEILRADGATAIPHPVTAADLGDWMDRHGAAAAWHVAEDDAGAIPGFQYVEPHVDLPPEACSIATFTKPGRAGLGIGSALFEETRKAARALGYLWISARIRADNEGGLIYYQSRGFEVYDGITGQRRAHGPDQVLMRYDL